jgi:voltage-gated potassium channel
MTMHLTRFAMRRLEGALESGRILRYLLATIAVMAVASGVIIRIVDPEDFPSLGLALWWAVTTVTTVGYGDVVPVQPAGRAVASVLMIVGYASLSLLTGIIASVLVRRRNEAEEPPPDFKQLDRRLAEIERLLQKRAQ